MPDKTLRPFATRLPQYQVEWLKSHKKADGRNIERILADIIDDAINADKEPV